VGSYTVAALASVAVVVLLEASVLRTGLFRRVAFWAAYAICLFFQVLVDGWLTKLSAPIVLYDEDHTSGLRFPWDVPVEDYLYGFALVTLTIALWERGRDRPASGPPSPPSGSAGPGRGA
jgi:lycopene cyclase domain-containing protein